MITDNYISILVRNIDQMVTGPTFRASPPSSQAAEK